MIEQFDKGIVIINKFSIEVKRQSPFQQRVSHQNHIFQQPSMSANPSRLGMLLRSKIDQYIYKQAWEAISSGYSCILFYC